jgi:hypothetical protein
LGHEGSEFRVQWTRFEDDCDLHPLVQTVAHAAFKVDDLDRAIQGRTVIHGPEELLEGFRVACSEDGARERELAEAFLACWGDPLILAP